jgi:hypothetical protein
LTAAATVPRLDDLETALATHGQIMDIWLSVVVVRE